jgi:hypothetical protein
MNYSKLVLFLSCFLAVTLASPIVTAKPRGGGGHRGGGSHFSGGRHFATTPGRAGMGGRNWSGRSWSGRDWSGGNWSGDWWQHPFSDGQFIWIGGFGYPYYWNWYHIGAIITRTTAIIPIGIILRIGTIMIIAGAPYQEGNFLGLDPYSATLYAETA